MGDVNELKKERNKTMANLPGSIKNLNTLLGEQLLEGGGSGGGSSDFSTAEVTFICTKGEPDMTTQVINIQDDGIYSVLNIKQSIQTVTVPLYKNKLSCGIPPLSISVTSTSGNITGSQMDGYIISGNCTINYTLPL